MSSANKISLAMFFSIGHDLEKSLVSQVDDFKTLKKKTCLHSRTVDRVLINLRGGRFGEATFTKPKRIQLEFLSILMRRPKMTFFFSTCDGREIHDCTFRTIVKGKLI